MRIKTIKEYIFIIMHHFKLLKEVEFNISQNVTE